MAEHHSDSKTATSADRSRSVTQRGDVGQESAQFAALPDTAASVLQMQRLIGNRAVSAMLSRTPSISRPTLQRSLSIDGNIIKQPMRTLNEYMDRKKFRKADVEAIKKAITDQVETDAGTLGLLAQNLEMLRTFVNDLKLPYISDAEKKRSDFVETLSKHYLLKKVLINNPALAPATLAQQIALPTKADKLQDMQAKVKAVSDKIVQLNAQFDAEVATIAATAGQNNEILSNIDPNQRFEIGSGEQHNAMQFASTGGQAKYNVDDWTNTKGKYSGMSLAPTPLPFALDQLSTGNILVTQIVNTFVDATIDPATGFITYRLKYGATVNQLHRNALEHLIGLSQKLAVRLDALKQLSNEGYERSGGQKLALDIDQVLIAARTKIIEIAAGTKPELAPPKDGDEDSLPALYINPMKIGGWTALINEAQAQQGHAKLLDKLKPLLEKHSFEKLKPFFNHLRFYLWSEHRALYELSKGNVMQKQ